MSGKAAPTAAAAAAPEAGAASGGDSRPGFKRIPKPDQAKFDGQIATKEAQITTLEAQLADVERKIASKLEASKGQRVRVTPNGSLPCYSGSFFSLRRH